MTNTNYKPMLSVERDLIERAVQAIINTSQMQPALNELRALLDKPAEPVPDCIHGLERFEADDGVFVRLGDVIGMLANEKAAKHQGEPAAQPEFEHDALCIESDGCPTEGAVLKRFWRENQPDMALCEFYEAVDYRSLVKELVGHVAQLQDAAKRNVKPWEDTFPPTLLPAYIARTNAEQPAPVAVSDFYEAFRFSEIVTDEQAGELAEIAARLNGVKP